MNLFKTNAELTADVANLKDVVYAQQMGLRQLQENMQTLKQVLDAMVVRHNALVKAANEAPVWKSEKTVRSQPETEA